jgi:hypothetical protein
MRPAGAVADLQRMAATAGRVRALGRIAAVLASAAVAASVSGSAQAATYAWGISKSISGAGDSAFTLAPGASRIVDFRLLVVNTTATFGPSDGSESATVTDEVSCPAGFACTRVGAASFPMTVNISGGSFRTIFDAIQVTNVSALCGKAAALVNTATVTPNGGTRAPETRTQTATITTPGCVPMPTIAGPGNITVNATSYAGARVTYTVTATGGMPSCRNGSGALVSSGSQFPIGTTTVTCSVTNTAGTASMSFLVTVRGAPEQLADLIALGLPRSLAVKLEHAQAHLQAGQLTIACNIMRAFQREARAQAGHQLGIAQAASVVAAAARISAVAGCSRPRG